MAAAPPRVGVALSGGRDSMALLHAAVSICAPLGIEVIALHVHHGLQPDADAWLAHCEDHCAARRARGERVRFASRRIATHPARGESVEAWARTVRYAALAEMAAEHHVRLVLLAHHRRDQAETLLLQALRGAGVAGLAAMPQRAARQGIVFARPWLAQPREAIEAYAARAGLRWVDDQSNADPRQARNRLRRDVWPVLVAAFPDAEAALADSAAWAAEAMACLDDLAGSDLAACVDGAALDVAAWARLGAARRGNALRAWLRAALGVPPPAALTRRLRDELPSATSARWPAPGGELRCHRGRLRFAAVRPVPADGATVALAIRRAGTYRIAGWGGLLRVRRVPSGGVALAALAETELRARHGGEQFQAGTSRPPRSLKKQFQAAGVAAWERDGPLVYAAGRLVYVPGLGLDARVAAADGTPQVELDWQPDRGTAAERMLRRNR